MACDGTLTALMSSTAIASTRLAPRPAPGALVDVAVAGVALVATVMLLRHGGLAPSRPGSVALDPAGVALAVGSTVPLVAWRRSPLGVFSVTAAVGVLAVGLGHPLDLLLGPTVALYHLTSNRGRGMAWTPRTTAVVAGLLAAYLAAAAAAQQAVPGSELLHTGLACAVAWFAGERTRLRRGQIAELEERAHRAEREVERERLLAAAEERTRIARDLHDSAGHAISVIAVRAGAARLRHHADPARSLAALEAIEQVARQTADDIDRMVGALRDGAQAQGAARTPVGLAGLDTLIARHRRAGLVITVGGTGVPRPLPAAVDQAAYRILQEALTNAARHGTGSAVIELAVDDAAVELRVTNPAPVPRPPRSGGGHGLVGMRERATRLGGRFEAEHANGAFRVLARIPCAGHPT
ncbi:MAG TPA: histidine kinase [Euzebyales bacterium]|nr:histidine kinase [Euzebyales bacterium]